MSRSFAASMRRATRLMRPRRSSRAASNVGKAAAGFMMASTLAQLKPMAAKSRKAKPRKAGQSLGAVLAQLRAAQSPARPEPAPRTPKGAQYLARTHRSAAGSRSYKLYVPTKQPRGLILMLHGCSQTPDDFAVGTRMNALAEKHGLAVAYPAQLRTHNAAACWNWFKPGHQLRGAGEPAILASLTRKLMREFGLGRDRVYVAGLSAGGSMAVILADLYPDLYAAAGVHSGLARGSARDAVSAIRVMRKGASSGGFAPAHIAPPRPVRRIVFQGASDRTVHASNAATIVAAAIGSDAVARRIGTRTAGGRGYARSEYAGPDGAVLVELWMIEGAGHAWSGGREAGSYADRKGPNASAHMVRFFLS